MDPQSLPWEKGIAAVFATALLVIFIDVAYRKLPRGFSKIRLELRHQTIRLSRGQKSDRVLLQTLLTHIERLDTAIASLLEYQELVEQRRGQRRPRSKKKSTGPAGRKG